MSVEEKDSAEHSFGPEWEEKSKEVLSEVDFDTELGIELAKDAERLSKGEISEDEFFSRHNEEVREEFGVDARPTDPRSSEPLDKDTVEDALNDDVVAEPVPSKHAKKAEEMREAHETAGGGGGDGGRGGDGDGDDDDGGLSRRSVLKSVGVAAAGIAAGTWSQRNPGGIWDEQRQITAGGPGTDDEDKQIGFVIDVDACIGGAHCAQGCKFENKTPDGALWQFVFQYQDPETNDLNPDDDRSEAEYLIRPCQHCSDPPCVSVCPVRARHKRTEDGIVLTDYEICIGCRYCQVACPYGVNYFQWGEPNEEKYNAFLDNHDSLEDPEDRRDNNGRFVAGPQPEKGIMGKCTFCVHRQDSGDPDLEGTTACYEACPVSAIHVGDLNDPESKPRQYLKEVQERTGEAGNVAGYDTTSDDAEWQSERHVPRWRFQEDRGTKPNVIYVGHQPSEDAEWAEKPQSYDEYSSGLYNIQKEREGFELEPGHHGGGHGGGSEGEGDNGGGE